jgi:hypothetical protein
MECYADFSTRRLLPSKVRAQYFDRVRSAAEAKALRLGPAARIVKDSADGWHLISVSAFAELTTSLRSAAELTKAMLHVSDINTLRSKILDLTKEIMSAQSGALATQSTQLELLQSKRDLEDELAKVKAWNMEKYRYELQNVGSGAVAYVLKQSMRGTEPTHWICANCFQTGKKRFLNESDFDLHFVYYKCQECAGKIRIRKAPRIREPDLLSFESSDQGPPPTGSRCA